MALNTILLIVQVASSLAIIILVLLQQGKGADMGSSFGSGSAGSLFGASGAANFLSRSTKWAAVVFFASTAGLAYITHSISRPGGVDSGVMQNFQQDRSVPQAAGAAPPAAGGADASGPSVPAAPAPSSSSGPAAPAK
jgi:preprotein translocase subunit SecG